MKPLRVAAWQCVSQPLDVAGNLARLERTCVAAAAEGVDVVVTPEMFVTGYDIGGDETRRLAEPHGGPIACEVAEITRRTGVAVVYGYPELDGGDVYNSAQLVDDGHFLGRHRKLHLFGDLDRTRFTPGAATSDVVELRGHRVGLLICYDVEFPEAVRAAALEGAEAVLVPTANMTGFELVSTVLVRARSYENGCYVVYANYSGQEGDLTYAGLSTVCSPSGTVLALAATGEELLVTDLADLAEHPTYLADRRADLFRP